MLNFPVGISIEAIDQSTAKVRSITAGIVKATKPLNRLQGAFKGLSEAAGFPRLMDGFKGVGDALGNLVDSAKRAGLYIGGAIAGAAVGLFALVKGYANAGDSATKAAQKIGISVEALQELRYAGDLANVETDLLDASLVKLTRNAALAARGQRSAARPFERLGIAVKDQNGHIRNASSLLGEIADKFGRLDDPLKKAALAQELFGKTGANLIPLLNDGSAGLAKAAAEARRFGIVLSKEDAAAGEEFMDALTRIGAVLAGVRNTIGREMLPVLQDMAVKFREWVVDHLPQIKEFARRLAEDLPRAVDRTVDAFSSFWAKTESVRKLLGKVYDLVGPLGLALGAVGVVLVVSLTPAIFSTVGALATLSAALVGTPAGWVVLALTAVAAAFAVVTAGIALLILNWDSISKRFPRLAALAESLGVALLKHLATPLVIVIGLVLKLLESMESLLKHVPDWAWKLVGVDVDKLKAGDVKPKTRGQKEAAALGLDEQGDADPNPDTTLGALKAAIEELNKAAASANKLRPDSIPILDTLTGSARLQKQETAVTVDFKNVPKGTRVSSESKGAPDVKLDVGYSLQGP